MTGAASTAVGNFKEPTMKRFALIGLLALAGCDKPPLTNDQVIRMSKQCTDAGLIPVEFPGWDFRTRDIQCQNHIKN